MINEYIVFKSPVKIGDYARVDSYAKGLVKGEEHLLVTRDCKFYLTDGKGGYLEFKSINSGITMDEVNQKLLDLQNSLTTEFTDYDNSLHQDITNLSNNINPKIILLQDAVDALQLEFNDYVTLTQFNAMVAEQTHDNREVLDLFSKDSNNNPLFDGKKIVADFDTSGIEAEIASLNARGVIGGELDYGLFGISAAVASIPSGTMIPFNLTYSNKNLTLTNNVVRLKKGKSYSIRAASTTQTASVNMWYYAYDVTHSKTLGKDGFSGSLSNVSIPSLAIITCTEDTDIGVKTINNYGLDTAGAMFTYLEIIEIGRTTIIDPAEDAKKIQFEYGYFTAAQSTNLSAGNHLELDMIKGNMVASTGTGQAKGLITFKANKKYELIFSYSNVGSSGNGVIDFNLCDVSGNILKYIEYAYVATYGGNAQDSPVTPFILEPTIDTIVQFKINSSAATWVGANLTIREIAQPYYFNYYKDSISSTVLFDGDATTVGSSYTLSDDITKYEYIIVYSSSVGTETVSNIIKVSDILSSISEQFINSTFHVSTYYYSIIYGFPTNKTLKITNKSNCGWASPSIRKIHGIGYNYQNPYQDIITTSPDAALTDAQVDTDITGIWSGVGL